MVSSKVTPPIAAQPFKAFRHLNCPWVRRRSEDAFGEPIGRGQSERAVGKPPKTTGKWHHNHPEPASLPSSSATCAVKSASGRTRLPGIRTATFVKRNKQNKPDDPRNQHRQTIPTILCLQIYRTCCSIARRTAQPYVAFQLAPGKPAQTA